MKYNNLKVKALELRQKTFKAFIETGEAHLGGSFSMIEIIIFLFECEIKKKDKLILSKSHSSYPLCLTLKDKGYNPKLTTHLELDEKNKIFCTTGSLGHGLPISAGIAFARKIKNIKGKVYVIISDGECQEGTTWETLLIASKLKLNNLVVIVDYNKIQALSTLKEGLPLKSLSAKFKAFNWDCVHAYNGHSFGNLNSAFKKIKKLKRPTVILAHTIKGKGIKEFENNPVWHARKLEKKDILIGTKRLNIK